MTEQESAVERRSRRTQEKLTPPRWPGDPEQGEGIAVDFEAVACVLANTCRWGGRTRRFLSLAQHALTASEEIEALDGIADGDRRALGLHALLADARAAWPGGGEDGLQGSVKAAARAKMNGAEIDRAVRRAAGLDPDVPEEWAEVLRFVDRMTDAAERRDLGVGAGGWPFLPLRRRIRPMAPEAAAERWLARLGELRAGAGSGGGAAVPGAAEGAP